MIYRLNDEFTMLDQSEAIMQNLSRHAEIEIVSCSEEPKKDSGLLLLPLEKLNFTAQSGEKIYVRCAKIDGTHANLAVVNFKKPASSGEGAGGDMVGDIKLRHILQPGYVKADGSLLNRADYPMLFEFAQENGLLLTEADWANGMQGMYAEGDGVDTFRVPDLRGQFLRCLDDGAGVDIDRTVGSMQGDAIRNIEGTFSLSGTDGGIDCRGGAFCNITNGTLIAQATKYSAGGYAAFDASRVVPTAEENRPKNIALIAQIKY